MKKYLPLVVLFVVLLAGVPLLAGIFLGNGFVGIDKKQKFTLELTGTGEVLELTAVEYLTGCLYAQVRIDYEPELLKAQAAAAYTYALRIIENNRRFPANKPVNADFTDSSAVFQPYFTEQQARAQYGDDYDKYYPNVLAAAQYGAKTVMVYNNEPIYAVYHSVSAGRTNTAYGVWGTDYDYLQSVDSEQDKEFPYFECTNEFSVATVKNALLEFDADISMPLDYAKWFTEPNINENGYLISIKAGNTTISGGELRQILGLRSTAAEICYKNNVFSVVTKGFGHGAGLSQYGGNQMAKQGKTAEEILKYYYTGIAVI